MSTPLLELRNLSTVYPARRGMVNAVDTIDLSLDGGDILGLVGESGCGKSTVLLSILRLIRRPGYISGGEILFRGKDMRKLSPNEMRSLRGREIAMIFQDPLSTLNPVFQVGEQIREALELHNIMDNGKRRLFRGNTRKREKARVIEVMEEVGISTPQSRYRSYPHEFSGGMMQRALIAIALACNPAVLLADEPTTALDVTIQAQILNLMKRINQDHGTAIILVTHDLGVAAEFCDSIAVMYAGRIVEKGSVDQVVEDPRHPYTKGLLQCRPRITPVRERIAPIPGNVPDLSELPEGCAFSPRCPGYRQVCSQGPVPMVDLAHEGVMSRCLIHTNYERNPNWSWADRVEPAQAGGVELTSSGDLEELV
jgi:oligopeptide/dipeptide ABC transporter ATP-binding protein